MEEWLDFQEAWFTFDQIRFLQKYFLKWSRPRANTPEKVNMVKTPSIPDKEDNIITVPATPTRVPQADYGTFIPPSAVQVKHSDKIKVFEYPNIDWEEFFWGVLCESSDPKAMEGYRENSSTKIFAKAV